MELYVVLGLLAVVVVLLFTNWLSHAALGAMIIVVLTLTGINDPSEALTGFSKPIIMLYIGSFAISEAFVKSGWSERISRGAIRLSSKLGNREGLLLFIIALVTAACTSLFSALGFLVAMIPLILTTAPRLGISPKKGLLVLGYASAIGSTFALTGSSLNMLVKSQYELLCPGDQFGMFEMAPLTIPAGVVLLAFLCFVNMKGMKVPAPAPREAEPPSVLEDAGEKATFRQNAAIVICLLFAVLLALDGKIPIPTNIGILLILFLLGAFRVLTTKEILGSIRLDILLFIVGISALSDAISRTGVDDLLVSLCRNLLGTTPSLRVAVAILFVISSLLTHFMSNTATFIIMFPIGITLVNSFGFPLKPIIIAMCLGSGYTFATPMATPALPMLASAGEIELKHWLRQGIPMVLLSALSVIIFVPILWS